MSLSASVHILPPPNSSRFFVLVGRVTFFASLIFSVLGYMGIARAVEYRLAADSIPMLEVFMGLISAAFLLSSFVSHRFRENIYQYLIALVYIIVLAQVFRLYAAGFHSDLAFGSIVVTLLGCLFFFDQVHLLVYQLFAAMSILMAALMTSDPLTDMWMFVFRFITFHSIAYLIISFRIHMRSELREKDKLFRQLFEQLNDGVLYVDKQQQISLINALTETLSGYTQTELIGKSAHDLFPDWNKWLEEEPGTGGIVPVRTETQLTRKDGSRIWVSCSLSGIADEYDRPDGYVAVLTDITESRRAGIELRRTSEKLSRTNRELEQFSYFASHDLQAPLGTIRHYAQHLHTQARAGEPFSGTDKEAVEIILEDASRMNKLIDALLLYSSSGTASTESVELNMNDVVGDALQNLAKYIEESGATIHCENLPILSGDRVQLTRLMQNLIGNSILYRKEEPLKVTISVSLNESASAHVFAVQDNGIGIDSKDYQRVFQMFQQLGPEGNEGLGVGLAICKRVIDNHNGSIWLKSIKGKGTTIFFSLPT